MEKSMMEDSANYPRFISNKACGKDKTEGGSQEHLVAAIAEHIVSTDASDNQQDLPRVIGLKGEWGSGKTNVIKQLEQNPKIKEKYYVFEYDAWGHQEDLQRRSFLETLTTELIKDEKDFLQGNKKVVQSWETGQKISWKEKLNELLAHKRITENKSIPVFNAGALWTAIFLALTPISVFISERLEARQIIEKIPWLVLIAFSPILLGIIVWGITAIFNKDARCLGYLLKISKNETTQTKNIETINEDEPSVMKFNMWMNDLSEYISEYKRPKLIIVYDNMDRLPADKVKELWSSIHTFFSETGFENIWILIPFDEKHLSCAFGENKDKEELTKQFISKTFPVVYRITPPVITDYKKLFDDLFIEAFGNTEANNISDEISRIFRIEKPNATIREMIEFINHLVALKRIWKNEINLLHAAVFILKEKEILGDPIEQILSGKYLGNYISKILVNNEELQTTISLLVYGVSQELARQIPMKKYIESCFESEKYDINKYSQSPHFMTILKETVQDIDVAKIDGAIMGLSTLDMSKFENNNKSDIMITGLWDELASIKLRQEFKEQEFDKKHEILLSKTSDKNKKHFIEYMCNKIQNFQPFGSKSNELVFSGRKYFTALKKLEECVTNNNLSIDLSDFLEQKQVTVTEFIEYVREAKDEYKKFNLYTDEAAFNNYFFKKDDYKIDDLCILKYIKDDKRYKIDTLKDEIEKFIQTDEVNEKNFKQIFDAYKIISDDKPLNKQLTANQRSTIWSALSSKANTEEYLEIATMQLANSARGLPKLSEEQIKYIATQIDYYANYGTMLVRSIGTNDTILNSILKYMTENKLGYRLSWEEVLPKFFDIAKQIDVSESTLISQLNDWEKHKKSITKDNIKNIVPNSDFFLYSKETKNELTDHINKTAIEALSTMDEKELYNSLNDHNNYWYKVIDALIDTNFCKPLPANLSNLGIQYLQEVATNNTIPEESDLKHKIINCLDRSKTKNAILDIRNSFCNSNSTMSTEKFLCLESWLRKQGELKERATEVIYKIISPIIDNEECLNLIIANPSFYAELINGASDVDEIKEKIQEKVNSSGESKLIEFAKLIGINQTTKKGTDEE